MRFKKTLFSSNANLVVVSDTGGVIIDPSKISFALDQIRHRDNKFLIILKPLQPANNAPSSVLQMLMNITNKAKSYQLF